MKPINTKNTIIGCTGNKYDFSTKNGQAQDSKLKLAIDLGIGADQIILLKQEHSDKIIRITSQNINNQNLVGDAIITNLPNILLGIKTADCIPVLIHDATQNTIAVIHLSRQTVLIGLLEKVVGTLVQEYDCNVSNLKIYMMPSLQAQNHLVYESEYSKFPDQYSQKLIRGVHIINNANLVSDHLDTNNLQLKDLSNMRSAHLNLQQLVKDKLTTLGVNIENIVEDATDTFQDNNYHSYRRDYPNNGLMLSYIILQSN